jgi:dihydrolipoamide dehydrogenase
MAKELDQAGVLLLPGTARIMRPGAAQVAGPEVEGDPREVAFHHLILATGSQPAAFPGLEPDGDAVLDSTDLLDLDQPLENLIVVGGGAIGLELAEFHRRLGAEVTVVEAMDRLLPAEDPEIASLLAGRLKRSGWNLRLGARVESLTTDHGRAHLRLADGEALAADKALVAVGRRPNSADLGLDALGAEPQGRGWIETDEHLRFAEGCYAVGDVNGRALLAHAASHQGEYAVRHILGAEPGPYSPGPIPSCVYGSVEVMRVGPTPAELAEESGPVAVSRVQFAANPIAQAHGAGHGLVKVAWAGERVASITAVGHHASHLVTQAGLIVEQGWTADDAGRRIFAHPTLDESLKAALLAPRQAIEGGS